MALVPPGFITPTIPYFLPEWDAGVEISTGNLIVSSINGGPVASGTVQQQLVQSVIALNQFAISTASSFTTNFASISTANISTASYSRLNAQQFNISSANISTATIGSGPLVSTLALRAGTINGAVTDDLINTVGSNTVDVAALLIAYNNLLTNANLQIVNAQDIFANNVIANNISTNVMSTNTILGGDQLQIKPVGSFDYTMNIESSNGNTYYEATWLDTGILQVPHKMRMVCQPEYPNILGARGRLGYFIGGSPAGEFIFTSTSLVADVYGVQCMNLSNGAVNATTVNNTSNNADYVSTNQISAYGGFFQEYINFTNTSSVVQGPWIREDQYGNLRLSTVGFTDIWTESRSVRLMGTTLDGDQSLARFSTLQAGSISTPTTAISVYSSNTQTVLAGGAQTPLTYNDYSFKEGQITWAGNGGSTITVLESGNYEIDTSIQFDTSSGGANAVSFWFMKNGTAISWSASAITVTGNGEVLGNCSILDKANAGDQYAINMASGDGNMAATAYAATGNIPGTPSVITNIRKI